MDFLALVVERKPVVLHVVEPDLFCGAALYKPQHGSGYAGVGAEHPARHRDHGVKTVLLNQQPADFNVRPARSEQHAVGDDDCGAASVLEQTQEEMQEKNLRLLHPRG